MIYVLCPQGRGLRHSHIFHIFCVWKYIFWVTKVPDKTAGNPREHLLRRTIHSPVFFDGWRVQKNSMGNHLNWRCQRWQRQNLFHNLCHIVAKVGLDKEVCENRGKGGAEQRGSCQWQKPLPTFATWHRTPLDVYDDDCLYYYKWWFSTLDWGSMRSNLTFKIWDYRWFVFSSFAFRLQKKEYYLKEKSS